MCFEKPRNMLLFETHVASRRLNSAHQTPAPHAERTSQNAIDSHHTPAFLGILGVTPRQKPALHLERGRMKTFWTNLPLTIRAAVIFCYAYAAVRILNLFYEAGTAPLTPRTLLDGALTVALVVGALALYLGNALGAALRARRSGAGRGGYGCSWRDQLCAPRPSKSRPPHPQGLTGEWHYKKPCNYKKSPALGGAHLQGMPRPVREISISTERRSLHTTAPCAPYRLCA